MLKDIVNNNGVSSGVAIVKELNESLQEIWNAYFINFSNDEIKNVMVSCKGYGEVDGHNRETAITRLFIGDMPGESYALIEPFDPALFVLNNDYVVTYYVNQNIIDKKYTFKANTISDNLLSDVELIDKQGILIS